MLACQAHSIMDNRFPSKNTEQVPHLLDPGDEELRQALFALARDGTNSRLVMVYPKAERKELDEGASGHHFLLVAKFVQCKLHSQHVILVCFARSLIEDLQFMKGWKIRLGSSTFQVSRSVILSKRIISFWRMRKWLGSKSGGNVR